jgi:hypothetical protein
MSDSDDVVRQDWAEGGPERLYVVAGSRRRPIERALFDLVTLIVARSGPKAGMPPEQAAILRMCANPLSVAEISAYLSLPTSMVTVLIADLADSGEVEVRAPVAAKALPDVALLEAVVDGLSKI